MPASELLCVLLLLTVEAVVWTRLIPWAVWPLTDGRGYQTSL